MARARKEPVVALTKLLALRFPDFERPEQAIVAGRVLVDGRSIRNPAARVRRDARLQVLISHRLRGHEKLTTALAALTVDLSGRVALDVGAAAGGFTEALLDRGARRVYAVDAGFGQLAGRLRADPRVVNLERTNVAALDASVIPGLIDVVTMDLSYLPVASAIEQLERVRYARHALLLALVKPTFELGAGTLVTDAAAVRAAIAAAVAAIERQQWLVTACTLPVVTGANGAIEAFVLAERVGR